MYFISWVIFLSYIWPSKIKSVSHGLLVPLWVILTLSAYCKGTFTTAQWLDIKKWPKGLWLCICFEIYGIKQVREKGLKVITHSFSIPVALTDLSFAPPVTIPPSESLRCSLQKLKLLSDLHAHTHISPLWNFQLFQLWDLTPPLTMGVGKFDSTLLFW